MTRCLMTAAALALCLSAPACAQRPGEPDDPPQTYTSLSAPTPKDVAVRLVAEDAGKTVPVRVGAKIAVELVGVPTAGYVWDIAEQPSFLLKTEEYGGPTSSAQLQPGFAGGSHWEAFAFQVTDTGEGKLRLAQRRPWDDAEPPVATFEVTLQASE